MTSDVCVCGHLEQTHDDGVEMGPCHSPTCECPAFEADPDFDIEEVA